MADTQTLAPAEQLAETNKMHFPNESAAYRRARNTLLVEEIELRRHIERVASQRRELPPGGQIPRDFEFVSEQGPTRLSELFGNKSTLMIYSMMYGPQRKEPCPMCTSFLSSWNGTAVNLRCTSGGTGTKTMARKRRPTRSGSRCPTLEKPPSDSATERRKHDRNWPRGENNDER
jgi:predicted dithiol-disulfide oxidoreductase (DUF899 family)